MEAPQIRRIFSCSPRDPRYHMLEHLSPKFRMPPMEREPRAALILNRFTRTLTIMFATNAVSSILGVRPDQIKNKSFYECIQENCLADALECLESAKANDSIAYLRFWYRDPRREEDLEMSEDDEEMDESQCETLAGIESRQPPDTAMDMDSTTSATGTWSNGVQTDLPSPSAAANTTADLRDSSQSAIPGQASQLERQKTTHPIELEAVVSCTSDGLVVVLRKARPPIPASHPPLLPFDFENGLFAAPWGRQSITPSFPPEALHNFQPPLLPQFMPLRENVKAAGGPPIDQLMRSIRDVAVFAWALVGINGNLAAYGRGLPTADSQFPRSARGWENTAAIESRNQCSGKSATREIGSRDDDGDDGGVHEPLRRLVAPDQIPERCHHIGLGLGHPPSSINQHRHRPRPPSCGSNGDQETCHSSSWTNLTDGTERGRTDRGCSYGINTSQAEFTKTRDYQWPLPPR